MSEADKMFEELGYKKITEHKFKEPEYGEVTELILYRDDVQELNIEFWNDKSISKMSNYEISYITMQELQAINMKVKELRMDMRINFLDKEFPKEFKSKLYELDSLINKLFNLKSYKIEFDTNWLFYYFTLNFENFTLCFNLKIEDMRYLKSMDILGVFSNGLQRKINEIYYKNRGVIDE